MGVSGYFEFVTTLFGWILYDNIWAVLADTGIIFLPIIAMMIKNIKSSHEGGDDEGNAAIQSLKKIEGDFFAMIAVLIFAVMPMMDVELSGMKYTKPALNCAVASSTVQGTDTETSYDKVLTSMAGQEGHIPLWWAALHWLSKAVTAGAMAGIPCSTDLASVEYKMAENNITNPDLIEEMNQFYKDCWQRAYSAYARMDKTSLTDEEIDSVNWIGSSYFLSSGLYGQYTARSNQSRFPYDPTRDASYGEDIGEGGFPACHQWWQGGTAGLRQQILNNLESEFKNEMIYSAGSVMNAVVGTSLTNEQKENVFLRKYLTVRRAAEGNPTATMSLATSYSTASSAYEQAQILKQQASDPDGSWLSRSVAWVDSRLAVLQGAAEDLGGATLMALGGLVKSPVTVGEGYGMRNGISMFQALALMMFAIALPFLMIFGGYSLKTLVTLSVVFFGLHFLTFLWGIAYWMDNKLMEVMMASDMGIFDSASNASQGMILQYMSRFLYVVFPTFYLMGMGWIGVNVGNMAQAMGTYNSTYAGSQGAAGGQAAGSIATGGAGMVGKAASFVGTKKA